MKTVSMLGLAAILSLAISSVAMAQVIDDTPAGANDTVVVTADVGANVTFILSPDAVSFQSIDVAANTLTVAESPLILEYTSNHPAWAIQMYTDNVGPGGALENLPFNEQFPPLGIDADEDGVAERFVSTAGGMIGANPANRIGIAWNMLVDEDAPKPPAPSLTVPVGDPKEDNPLVGWVFLNDATLFRLSENGDPANADDYEAVPFDFTNPGVDPPTARILQGGVGNSKGTVMQFDTDLTNDGDLNDPDKALTRGDFPASDGKVAIWLGANFKGATPDTYATEIQFDIVHF